jgi:acyl-CoA synthetase (AMP-forming)/AMP-acid ligase II
LLIRDIAYINNIALSTSPILHRPAEKGSIGDGMLISDFFEKGRRNHPGAIALVDDRDTLTYEGCHFAVNAAAIALGKMGIGAGSRVAILAGNAVATYVVLLAIWRMGGCSISLNTRATASENADMVVQSETQLVVVQRQYRELMDDVSRHLATPVNIATFGDAGVFEAVSVGSVSQACQGKPQPDDVAWIVFTGGTTGRSKGVMLTHRALVTMTLGMQAHLSLPVRPRYLLAAPMTHAAGTLIPAILGHGGCVRFLPAVDPQRIAAEIEANAVNVLFLPPTAIYMMLAMPNIRQFNYESLTHLIYAAAPMAEDKLVEAIDVFGPVLAQMYGQSEYPMIISYMGPEAHLSALEMAPQRLASAGQESMIAHVAVLDEEGNELADGEIGEISVRGPLLMKGYLGSSVGPTCAQGWLRTGDIGRRDNDGYIYLLDRSKDMIISGGFNVYSIEVENVLLGCDEVAQCAVIGVPDEKWGEAVKALVELKPGQSIAPEALIARCRDQLGSVKAPKTLEIWQELPRNGIGKIQKREIRERFWKGQARRV